MTNTPHPLHQALQQALKHYDNLGLLEGNALTSLDALWPLPSAHWHDSLAAPRRGIALRRLLDTALAQLATRLPDEHTLLVTKYLHKTGNPTLQADYSISKATLHNRLNEALDALAAEIATLDEAAVATARQRLTLQTAFLPGYAPETIVGLGTLLDSFLGAVRQRLNQPRTPILITGLGGIGKTTLLDTGLRLWLRQEAPPVAGVLYVRVATGEESRQTTFASILNTVLTQLSVQLALEKPLSDPITPETGLTRLVAHLATQHQQRGHRYVIVLDDIESPLEHEVGLRFAQAVSGNAIVVLASRQNPELSPIRSTIVRVQELNKRASAMLVRAVRASSAPHLPPLAPSDIKQIVTTVGGHPLALGLVVAQLGVERLPLEEILTGLREEGALSKHLYDRIYERSWALLSPMARKVLGWFTNFPTAGVTGEAVQSLKAISQDELSTRTIERAMGELSVLNLLQRITHPHTGFALHRLTYEFVEYKTARRSIEPNEIEDVPSDDDDDFFFAND